MLQGSLENFSLDEVLSLLSGSEKTGRLEVNGERGAGALLFNDGMLVGASSDKAAGEQTSIDHMFELLRFESGDFSFIAEPTSGTEAPQDLNKVLTEAKTRLEDWREIEAVVPTLNHIVTPSADLPEYQVTINREEWATLNIIGTGCNVSRVCDELSLDEIGGSRRVKNLAERSLVLIGAPINLGTPESSVGENAAFGISEDSEAAPVEEVDGKASEQDLLDQLQPPVADQVVEAPEPAFEFNSEAGLEDELEPIGAESNETILDAGGQFPGFPAEGDEPSAFTNLQEETGDEEEAGGGLLKRYLGGDS